jgi:nucleotide-binding universal stress UspA family protein
MQIVVATDLSPSGANTLELGKAVARALGDGLYLVHAFHMELILSGEAMMAMPNILAETRRAASTQLSEMAAKLSSDGVTVSGQLVDGMPAETVVEFARAKHARMIVVGTHARSAPARLVLGSVAERIALLADRPVLVAKMGAQPVEASWTGGRPLRVALAIDGSSASRAAIDWVRELARSRECEVTMMHAYWPLEQYARIGAGGAWPDADKLVTDSLERRLAPLMERWQGQRRPELRLLPTLGSFPERLASEADALGADLLVIGNHQRRALRRLWLGSTSHPTLRAATMPVLIVPTGEVNVTEEPLARVRAVLLATDLSDFSKQAVPHAFGLVEAARGLVHVCYVHERSPVADAVSGVEARAHELAPERRAAIEKQLRSLAPWDALLAGVATRVSVVEATNVGRALCQAARRFGVDAICLASHGRSGLREKLLGSVAHEVLTRADMPVFVVRVSSD